MLQVKGTIVAVVTLFCSTVYHWLLQFRHYNKTKQVKMVTVQWSPSEFIKIKFVKYNSRHSSQVPSGGGPVVVGGVVVVVVVVVVGAGLISVISPLSHTR